MICLSSECLGNLAETLEMGVFEADLKDLEGAFGKGESGVVCSC
jgi:hypothetical protein